MLTVLFPSLVSSFFAAVFVSPFLFSFLLLHPLPPKPCASKCVEASTGPLIKPSLPILLSTAEDLRSPTPPGGPGSVSSNLCGVQSEIKKPTNRAAIAPTKKRSRIPLFSNVFRSIGVRKFDCVWAFVSSFVRFSSYEFCGPWPVIIPTSVGSTLGGEVRRLSYDYQCLPYFPSRQLPFARIPNSSKCSKVSGNI